METSIRHCLACNKPLKGRIDKKFCDDYCRSMYNNQQNAETSSIVRNINALLKKNRRLLQETIPEGEEMGKCARKKLADAGFNFQYFTHEYTNKKGNVYRFCYEYGYLPLESDWILVVKRQQ